MKIRPVGAELFHANGLTDMMKLAVTFRNFANALSPGFNHLERNADNSHSFSAEVKKKWSYHCITPFVHYILRRNITLSY